MSRIIGVAEDFYRVRVTRLQESDEPDLEWRDDILYRTPPSTEPGERDAWRVEAVTLDVDETVSLIGSYKTSAEANEVLVEVAEALVAMTKSQFEQAYLRGDT